VGVSDLAIGIAFDHLFCVFSGAGKKYFVEVVVFYEDVSRHW